MCTLAIMRQSIDLIQETDVFMVKFNPSAGVQITCVL